MASIKQTVTKLRRLTKQQPRFTASVVAETDHGRCLCYADEVPMSDFVGSFLEV